MVAVNVLKTCEVRCSACKLPPEVRAALNADRLQNGLTFEDLVGKYGFSSPSGLRRHFARHAAAPDHDPTSEPGTVHEHTNAEVASPDDLARTGLDGHTLLEAGTRTLAEMVEALAREYREAVAQQRAQQAERAFSKFMKAQAELAKCVRQLEAGRIIRNEFRKTVPQIVQGITAASIRSTLPLIREYAERLREEVGEYVRCNVSADELLKRLLRYEVQVPHEVAARMRAAMTQALQTEEAKVQE
jgi:hypothetical protein